LAKPTSKIQAEDKQKNTRYLLSPLNSAGTLSKSFSKSHHSNMNRYGQRRSTPHAAGSFLQGCPITGAPEKYC